MNQPHALFRKSGCGTDKKQSFLGAIPRPTHGNMPCKKRRGHVVQYRIGLSKLQMSCRAVGVA